MSNAQIRIVHLSDTHLGFDLPVRPRVERPRRGEDFFANTKRALDHAAETCADLVIHTGDVFFRSRVPPAIVDRAYAMFIEAVEKGPPMVILPGNHERSRMPPSLLLNHPRIHVLDRPRAFRFRLGSRFEGGICEVVGFPYHRQAGLELGSFLDDAGLKAADFRILAVHQALEHSRVGPNEFTFTRRDDDVIRTESVPDTIDLVLAGHIHRRQVLSMGAKRDILGVHVGSIERTSYAEAPETKGFYEVRIRPEVRLAQSRKAGVAVRAHDPAERVELNFHPLPARPLVDVDLSRIESAHTARARAAEAVLRAPERAVVRVRVPEALLGEVRGQDLRELAAKTPGREELVIGVGPLRVPSPGEGHSAAEGSSRADSAGEGSAAEGSAAQSSNVVSRMTAPASS